MANEKNGKLPYDHMVKIIAIGDSGVGKTNLITRYTENSFKDSFVSTIGVDFKAKVVEFNHKKYKLLIWDTAGQQRFRNITQAYYKNAHCIILTYSINDRKSFDHLTDWMVQIQSQAPENVLKILVGTKQDLNDQRVILESQGKELAKKYNIDFIELSAKTNQSVTEMFNMIVSKINRRIQEQGDFLCPNSSVKILEPISKSEQKKCQC